MKQLKYILCFVLFCFELKAQVNLVPNYSFEDTVSTQMCFSYMGLNKTKYWFNPSNSTPDYINVCANTYTANYPLTSTIPLTCYGYQFPKTGNAMVGIGVYKVPTVNDSVNYYSEYVAVKLNDTLKAGVCYYGEFYAVLADVCEFKTNRLGMYLSQNSFTTSVGSFTNSIECQVQFDTTYYFTDTLNWVKISSTFTAQGGETHLTIGCFKDGDHLKKTRTLSSFNSLCSFSDNPHDVIYIYIDDVSLYECNPISVKEIYNKYHFKLYPNPSNDYINVEMDIGSKEQTSILIYNLLGECIKVQTLQNGITNLNLTEFNSGTYFYSIVINNVFIKKDKLIIIK
ncbi:MAG: T9SS type A sorting domain-containing protein [Bacteroidia bacterium]